MSSSKRKGGSARSRRVEDMRQRKAELDAERRAAELRIDEALVSYAQAADALDELEAQAEKHRTAQAAALQTMRDNGRSLDEIATMVELPASDVRRMTRRTDTATAAQGNGARPDHQEQGGEADSSSARDAAASETFTSTSAAPAGPLQGSEATGTGDTPPTTGTPSAAESSSVSQSGLAAASAGQPGS